MRSILDYIKVFKNIETYKGPVPRNMYSQGQLVTQLVTPNPDGSRPGYAPVKGWKEEKAKFFDWLAKNKDFDFANSSTPEIIKKSGTKFEVGTI